MQKKKKNKTKQKEKKKRKEEEQITTYISVVWLKFKLLIYGLKFDTLPT